MSDVMVDFLSDLDAAPAPEPRVYSRTTLSNETKTKLLSYQIKHVVRLVQTLLKHCVALDGSDTGTGKTFNALAACRELLRRAFIICPKTMIPSWISVAKFFGVSIIDIVNYETLRNGKTYRDRKFKQSVKSRYVECIDIEPDDTDPKKFAYRWDLPDDAFIIIDEAHRCKDPATYNGKLLLSLKRVIESKIPVLLLSATICEKVNDMRIPFTLFGIIPHVRNFSHYKKTLKNKYPEFNRKRAAHLETENAESLMINREIQDYTARLRVKDLGKMFPSNQWCAQQFIAEESDEIARAYEKIAKHLKQLREKPARHHLAEIVKLKMEIELRKAPIFIEQAQLYLENGKSVIIFVNYLDTLNFLADKLQIKCMIHGRQTLDERMEAIKLFQSNEERIIICQIRAGGVGISLHDVHGNHPRAALINYPDSASDLLQALGRAPRSGAKTPVIQRIIFVANVPYEQKIMKNINRKLNNISGINDGDLNTHKYKVMVKKTRALAPE